MPWEELTEHIKDSNRDQAKNFSKYLTLVECSYDSGDMPFPSEENFNKEEIEKIAKLAHEIWVKGKKMMDGLKVQKKIQSKKHIRSWLIGTNCRKKKNGKIGIWRIILYHYSKVLG